jgi:hypothetical protein
MKAVQIPILINNATTGHKLQGSGVENLFVHSWSNVKNWTYVVLSRVRTLNGLYFREKLSSNLSNYAMNDKLQLMICKFRDNFKPTMWTAQEYANLFEL